MKFGDHSHRLVIGHLKHAIDYDMVHFKSGTPVITKLPFVSQIMFIIDICVCIAFI